MSNFTFSKAVSSSVTRPANTTAYATGQVVGTAVTHLMTFTDAARKNVASGAIVGASLVDDANQTTKGDFDLFLFSAAVADQADQAAFAPTDAEMLTCIGRISFPGSSAIVGNAGSGAAGNVFYPSPSFAPMIFNASVSSIFGCLVARSAYTPVSGEKLTVNLRILQD